MTLGENLAALCFALPFHTIMALVAPCKFILLERIYMQNTKQVLANGWLLLFFFLLLIYISKRDFFTITRQVHIRLTVRELNIELMQIRVHEMLRMKTIALQCDTWY